MSPHWHEQGLMAQIDTKIQILPAFGLWCPRLNCFTDNLSVENFIWSTFGSVRDLYNIARSRQNVQLFTQSQRGKWELLTYFLWSPTQTQSHSQEDVPALVLHTSRVNASMLWLAALWDHCYCDTWHRCEFVNQFAI